MKNKLPNHTGNASSKSCPKLQLSPKTQKSASVQAEKEGESPDEQKPLSALAQTLLNNLRKKGYEV